MSGPMSWPRFKRLLRRCVAMTLLEWAQRAAPHTDHAFKIQIAGIARVLWEAHEADA